MTEWDVQNEIYHFANCRNHESIIPNIYIFHGWESDMLSITPAGYVHEYEVKVSLADFKADFGKRSKHRLLSGKDSRGIAYRGTPNYFWYVCPDNLIPVDKVPEYAGLLYLCGELDYWECIQKKAPLLHRDKATEKMKNRILNVYRYRYWSLRLNRLQITERSVA